ncbi:MAG: dihydroorotate dehydrogenase electron transfer subunit [Candidatus Micrarchaeota archaeon]|nr:dihydroorotate dehydrogenase electron transfer subunit [Candidatus Micrarchaeota archaeon]
MASHTVAKIRGIEAENELVKTLTLDISMPQAAPGQFVMCWLPQFSEEKPFSLSAKSPVRLTVAARGAFSKSLCGLARGQRIWIRGPYGRGFELKGRRILLVGGGYGFAPLRFLAEEAKKRGIAALAVCGARTKSLLLKPAPCETIFTTDDGSAGIAGNVLEGMRRALSRGKFDLVYACGPEKMMEAVAKLAQRHGMRTQLLTERYMKCGIGACGHCCMGEKLVCADGPMFYYEELKKNSEFGKVWRDKAGRKVPL